MGRGEEGEGLQSELSRQRGGVRGMGKWGVC
jgi:hypothetical protein